MAEVPKVELLLVGAGSMHLPDENNHSRRIQLQRRTIVVGRDPTRVDVCLAGVPAISRVHCTIHYDEEEECCYLIDNDSAFGVHVNGERVKPGEWYALRSGMDIELSGARAGGTLLRFYQLPEDNSPLAKPITALPGSSDTSTTIMRRPEEVKGLLKSTGPAAPAGPPAVPPAPLEKMVFLSYCRQDIVLMKFVAGHLRDHQELRGIEVWTDERLKVSDVWSDRLQEMLDRAAAMVVLVSPHTKTSEWVRNEIRYANDKSKRIFPLVISGSPRDVMPLELIRAQYIDLNPNPMASLESLVQALAAFFRG